jgi:hypothetical protein
MTEIEQLRAEVRALREEIARLRDQVVFDSARPRQPMQMLSMPVYPPWNPYLGANHSAVQDS